MIGHICDIERQVKRGVLLLRAKRSNSINEQERRIKGKLIFDPEKKMVGVADGRDNTPRKTPRPNRTVNMAWGR